MGKAGGRMRVLLTGATGFVGSHLLRGLLRDGHEVCVVKRSYSDVWRIKGLLGECHVYDLDQVGIGQIYGGFPAECVVHCATYYGRGDTEYVRNVNSNLLFPLELLEAGYREGARYFLNTDSFFSGQYTSEQGLDQGLYLGGYVLSKVQFRQWGRLFSGRYGMGFVNMKLEHVYGAMDDGDKFIPYVEKRCRENIPSIALSEGRQVRDFVHVSDVVDAYRAVLSHLERCGGPGYMEYGVGTGKTRSLREFVGLIHRAVHSKTRLDFGALPMKEGELMYSRADNLGLKEIGWEPKVVSDHDIEQKFGGGGYNICSLRFAIRRPEGRCA